MALVWQIPYTLEDNSIKVKSLNIETIYSSKIEIEINITNELNDKKLNVKWVELDEENNVIIIPSSNKILELILDIEPIERNPKKKSFDGKIIKPENNEVIEYGY